MSSDGVALECAVELLERSLAYTSGTLAGVRSEHLFRPTPCALWSLADLLAHMEDALDAFTEAAAGYVEVRRPSPTGSPLVDTLRDKACALLGAWLDADPGSVLVGDTALGPATLGPATLGPATLGPATLGPATLVSAAALEITVHGWDVGRATGLGDPVPESLAERLTAVAHLLVDASAPAPEFAPPRPATQGATAATRLLAWTGRGTEPPRRNRDVSVSREWLAS